jgi:hypothetical protein
VATWLEALMSITLSVVAGSATISLLINSGYQVYMGIPEDFKVDGMKYRI